jgi:hypothetical protein
LIQQSQYDLWQVMQKEGEIKVKAFAWWALDWKTARWFHLWPGWWFVSGPAISKTMSKVKCSNGIHYSSKPWITMLWIIISNSASTPYYICQSILFENQIWAAIIDIRIATNHHHKCPDPDTVFLHNPDKCHD